MRRPPTTTPTPPSPVIAAYMPRAPGAELALWEGHHDQRQPRGSGQLRPEALQNAGGDQQRRSRGEAAEQRGEGEEQDACAEHAPPVENVAGPPAEQQQSAERDGISGHYPFQAGAGIPASWTSSARSSRFRSRMAARGPWLTGLAGVTIRGHASSLLVPPRLPRPMKRSTKMNSPPERLAHDIADPLEPVGPSPIVKVVMRPMTTMLNPLIVKLAGRRRFHMAAQIRHVGRRSGRTYTTPVRARRSGDTVVIALTAISPTGRGMCGLPEAAQSGSRVRTTTSRSPRS